MRKLKIILNKNLENKMRYESETLNVIIECIDNYEIAFFDRGNQLTALGTFLFIIDEFDLDGFMSEHEITKLEYERYFKATTKKHNKHLHKLMKKEFKNKEK